MRKIVLAAVIAALGLFAFSEEPHAEISTSLAYIQYQTYSPESGDSRYLGYFEFLEDGAPLSSDCLEHVSLQDSSGRELEINPVFREDEYLWGGWNDATQEVEYSGPYPYTGYTLYFPSGISLESGNYNFSAITQQGERVSYTLYYPGKEEMPYVSKAAIQHQWHSDGSLTLSWAGPQGDFEKFMLWLMDGETYEDLLFVEQPNSSESLTIPSEIMADVKAACSARSMHLQLETRKSNMEGMNYARGITNYDIPLDSGDGSSAYAGENYVKVQKAYIAYYLRPGDPAGLHWWASQLEQNNGDMTAIIEQFATSEESLRLWGQINSGNIAEVIDEIYQGLFNRPADKAGKQYYVDEFNKGNFTAGTIVLNILNGAQGADARAIEKKLEYCEKFVNILDAEGDYKGPFEATYNRDDAVAVRTRLKEITSESSEITVETVKEDIIDNVAEAGDPILN